jgi:hypothetical protein
MLLADTVIPLDLARPPLAWHTDLRRADLCTVATCTMRSDLAGLRRLGRIQPPRRR